MIHGASACKTQEEWAAHVDYRNNAIEARCARRPALKRFVSLRVSDTHGFAVRTPD